MTSSAPCLHGTGTDKRCWADVWNGTGYCRKHYIPWNKKGVSSDLPPNWGKLQEACLRKAQGICAICGSNGADTADHIIPRSQGGSNLQSNLRAVHERTAPYCNRSNTALQGNAIRKENNTAKTRKFTEERAPW